MTFWSSSPLEAFCADLADAERQHGRHLGVSCQQTLRRLPLDNAIRSNIQLQTSGITTKTPCCDRGQSRIFFPYFFSFLKKDTFRPCEPWRVVLSLSNKAFHMVTLEWMRTRTICLEYTWSVLKNFAIFFWKLTYGLIDRYNVTLKCGKIIASSGPYGLLLAHSGYLGKDSFFE